MKNRSRGGQLMSIDPVGMVVEPSRGEVDCRLGAGRCEVCLSGIFAGQSSQSQSRLARMGMADHRMSERAGRGKETEHGRSRLPEDAQGVQLPGYTAGPRAGLVACWPKPRNQLLFSATGAHAPLVANALLTFGQGSTEHMRSKALGDTRRSLIFTSKGLQV